MGQKKLERFAAIKAFENVLEYPQGMPGKWKDFFKNDYSITLELACGKGEYALGLGKLYPEKNFLGVDVKGNRIWRGAKTALQENLSNVGFMRAQIEAINEYFSKDEVADIWITFPDPHLPGAKMKKRLTHPRFLRLYQQFLQPDGTVNLKTDSPVLYKFTKTVIELFDLELLNDEEDVYKSLQVSAELAIKTHYEKMDIAGFRKVHYLSFKINKPLPLEKDELLRKMLLIEV
ncbi:tRNA (guanosine(46)-N7)-methyltransferase TrmB [Arachidicoccus sp.]|uniref:tRNA (guanosine(46)-N7)-methyltransferase TrmB n=1 Tax=Arachidicoccus sp. TaxID=1872624 RepID=UPI003D1AA3C4